jgi:pimeloyl-ACP methyl ester carboxylesterase
MSEPRTSRRRLRRLGLILAGLLGALVLLTGVGGWYLIADHSHVQRTQGTVTSKDGTSIAFEKSGSGPVLVVVSAALADRSGTSKLAGELSSRFTVINYDRRGRGKSSDTAPYAVEREAEDIDALIDAAGGSAYLFGSSSGSVLALETANRLGAKVRGLFMYEPPFIIDDSHPPVTARLSRQVTTLVSAGRRNEAVRLFFTDGMGIPGFAVTMMRWLMPGWSSMAGMAQTIPYDLAVLDGTQTGKPLPAGRWGSMRAPALVMVGSRSEAFFHSGAKALCSVLPNSQYRALEGRDHSAILMAPKEIAAGVSGFFLGSR